MRFSTLLAKPLKDLKFPDQSYLTCSPTVIHVVSINAQENSRFC